MPVLQDGELVLYGFVGETYFEQGFTSLDVLDALAEIGRDTDVTVRMNSGGGYVHEGLAIYNALVAHKGEVTVQVDSIVASSASLIAMAGDRIVMKAGSLMMIHDPAGITFGTADDHEKTRIALDKMGDAFAGIYAERSGKDAADVRASMKAEIWLGADEAVAEGYADEAEAAKAKPAAAFDYRMYAHAPKKLVASARAKNWSHPVAIDRADPAHATARSEESMSKEPDLDAVKAEATSAGAKAAQARIKAIMSSDAAKAQPALAEHLAYETDTLADAAVAMLAKAVTTPTPPEPKNDTDTKSEPKADPEAYAADRAKASNLAQPTKPAASDVVARVLGNYRAVTGAPAAKV